MFLQNVEHIVGTCGGLKTQPKKSLAFSPLKGRVCVTSLQCGLCPFPGWGLKSFRFCSPAHSLLEPAGVLWGTQATWTGHDHVLWLWSPQQHQLACVWVKILQGETSRRYPWNATTWEAIARASYPRIMTGNEDIDVLSHMFWDGFLCSNISPKQHSKNTCSMKFFLNISTGFVHKCFGTLGVSILLPLFSQW